MSPAPPKSKSPSSVNIALMSSAKSLNVLGISLSISNISLRLEPNDLSKSLISSNSISLTVAPNFLNASACSLYCLTRSLAF